MSNYTKLNQRLPLFNYNKSKEDSLLTTYLDEVNQGNLADYTLEEEKKITKNHNYNTRRRNRIVSGKLHLINEDELFGTIEHSKCMKKALEEALDENEKVSFTIPYKKASLILKAT
jgi:hypothetical protein